MKIKPMNLCMRQFSSLVLLGCLMFSSLAVCADPVGTLPAAPAIPALSETPSEAPDFPAPGADGVNAEDGTVPVPPPSPQVVLNSDGYPLVESFAASLPPDFTLNLLYRQYLTNYDYALPKNGAGIRKGPGGTFDFIRTPGVYEKMNLVDSVKGSYIDKYRSDLWYRIYWYDESGIRTGYVYGPLISVRRFDLARKGQEARAVQSDLTMAGTIGFVDNYKNKRGRPPILPGGVNDVFGNDHYQSAPGYASLNNLKSFVYVQDGTLLLIMGQSNGYYQCRLPGKPTIYWIPKRYIAISSSIRTADQFIVIDRKQQNAAIFQQTADGWQLVSYQVITTGARDEYRYPTPLGAFMAIEKKPRFLYLDDETKKLEGYAPHTIRFSGGAYFHGVPVPFKKDPVTGRLTDPGETEYLATLGTVPRSHKCIRSYTSHAKFLYDWTKIGQSVIIVIE